MYKSTPVDLCLNLKLIRLQKRDPSCWEQSSIGPTPILQQINALFPKNALCCFSTLRHHAKIWVQEVMSVCVPVRDKSDIPTKPFPKINKQTSPVCAYTHPHMPSSQCSFCEHANCFVQLYKKSKH